MDAGSISEIPISYLIFVALLILGGAYFAAAETSFASVSRIRMISDADDGDKRAQKVLKILDDFDMALTTMLIGNNIMHIACSAVATLFASKVWGNTSVTIVTFVTTFIVFIFAEMIPKAYAKACCEKLAKSIAPSLTVVTIILKPIAILFKAITSVIAKLFNSKEEEEFTVTEEELSDIIEHIDEDDKIDEDTTELLQSALEFTETRIKEIMTPWDRVVTISDDLSEDDIYKIISENHFSRLPVLDHDGNIKGVLQIRTFLKAKIRGRKVLKSKSMLDKAYYVSASIPLDNMLSDLSSHRVHMAFVKNGAGQVIGLITVEDILEELVGEIYDEEEAPTC